jgi:CRP-like cAMP-binding protein
MSLNLSSWLYSRKLEMLHVLHYLRHCSIFFYINILIFIFHFFPIGDIIIKEGTIGSKMYFIQEGIVDIVMANGEVKLDSH